jgi:hypothetical protein
MLARMLDEQADRDGKLQALIWYGQDLSGDGRGWMADLVASGDRSLVPRICEALKAFVVLRNFYGRDLMAELLIGLIGVEAFPAAIDAWSVDIGDDRDSLTAMVSDLIDEDAATCLVTIRDLMRSPDPSKRSAGIWALDYTFEHVGIDPGDHAVLEAATRDPDAHVRASALSTLGGLKEDRSYATPPTS